MELNFQGTAGIFQDTHNPFQDQRVIREVELFLFELQPELMIYPGDMSDFYLLSKFDKNPNRADTLQKDLNSTASLFKRHREGMPNTRMIFTLGNHEDRLRRYLWSNSPALASLDCLTIEGLYKLKENEIECVDYEDGILFNGNFMVTHGNLIRAHSGYTAKAMGDKHGGSGVHGHSHRGGNSLKTNRFGVYGWWENFCESPDDLILLADLTWKRLGDVKVGDRLIGFDEFPEFGKRRKLRDAEVTELKIVTLPAKKIHFSDGRTVTSSYKHLWLQGNSRGTWIKTENIRVGQELKQFGKPWSVHDDRDSGYLAGVFDGEGWCDGFCENRPSIRLGFAQNDNQLSDAAKRFLKERGFEFSIRKYKNSLVYRILGGSSKSLEFLGSVRPPRLLSKVTIDGLAMNNKDTLIDIVGIEDVGEQELISLGTTTHTYFANGLASHNCLCDLDPDYVSHPDWQQGFSIVHFMKDRFWVEQMQIINRRFMYGGKTYGSGGKKRVRVEV